MSSVYAAVANRRSNAERRDYRKYQLAIADRLASLTGIFIATGCINPVDVFLIGVHSAQLFAFEMMINSEISRSIQSLYDDVQSLSKEEIYDFDEQLRLAKSRTIKREQLFFQ